MNKMKKIGLSALAGSLVAFSANAEITMSGGASVGLSQGNETAASAYYMADSINFTLSGETDSGLTITQKIELEGGVDNQSTAIAGGFGTVTFHKHGGDSVMSGWDDKTPNAYDESWGVATVDATTSDTTGTNEVVMINGRAGNNLWRYDSPSFSGVSIHASYVQAAAAAGEADHGDVSSYSDFGIQISPEMMEGLTIGYATGEVSESATKTNDESTLWVTYTTGPVSVGYQMSDVDGQTSTEDDEATLMSISYAVSDEFSVSYGQSSVDLGSSTLDQESKGVSASYTMGGVSISLAMNEVDNVGGRTATTHDLEAYDLNVAFAF
jgi:outer membrane protein OmpU